MAVTARWYDNALVHALSDGIDLTDGNLKVALCTSSYTPDQTTHEFFDDITNEVTASGYTAGGQALSSPTVTMSSHVVKLDAADTVWEDITLTARTAVVYYDTGTAGTSPLICYQQNQDADVSSTAGDWTITWNSSGIATITVSTGA